MERIYSFLFWFLFSPILNENFFLNSLVWNILFPGLYNFPFLTPLFGEFSPQISFLRYTEIYYTFKKSRTWEFPDFYPHSWLIVWQIIEFWFGNSFHSACESSSPLYSSSWRVVTPEMYNSDLPKKRTWVALGLQQHRDHCSTGEGRPFPKGFLGAQKVKNLPAMQETWVWFLGQEDPLEKGMQPTLVFSPGEFHGQRNLFEQTLGDSEGQGSLVCCSPWGHKESEMT